jgi:L-fuculose-phosphate aldolase
MEVHRAIYKATDARAVIHAHPSQTVSLSFFFDELRPIDENGFLYLGEQVPVIGAPTLFGWNLVADEMGHALVDNRVVVEKWHGTFAKGGDLAEAYHRTRAVEFMSAHKIQVARLEQYFGKPTYPPTEVADVIGGVPGRGLRRLKG